MKKVLNIHSIGNFGYFWSFQSNCNYHTLNKHFKEKGYTRQGSEQDVMRLTEIFEDLNFEVKTFLDLKSSEMRKKIREISKRDFSDDSCFLCFIMSHGNRGNTITSVDCEMFT